MAPVSNGFFDRLTEILLGVVAVVFGWAWTIDRRVSKLESQQETTTAAINELKADVKDGNKKLDQLIDRLL